ncbi:MAG: hypothetical protein K2Q20_08755 [Phycisphaerales bacterium]|nr:hypothetical protein [Phycisphaerales bacterium]
MSNIPMPPGMKSVRYQAPRSVKVGEEVPLIHPGDPAHKQIQERWLVHSKTFDLSKPTEEAEYSRVWQTISDGLGLAIEARNRLDFDPNTGGYKAFLQWVTYELLAPGAAPVAPVAE